MAPLAAIVVLLLMIAGSAWQPAAAEPAAEPVPAHVLAELAEGLNSPPGREGHAQKVRRYSQVIRAARGYLAEHAEAPDVYKIRSIMLAALQARMNLEADVPTYRLLLKTADQIKQARAPLAAKLEADLVLQRDRIRTTEPDSATLRRIVMDFAGAYQSEPAGAKALMYAATLAEAAGERPLVNVLTTELRRRPEYADQPGVIGFLRRSTDYNLAGRTFNATLRRLDGSVLHAPRDLLGKTTIIHFWASDDQRSTADLKTLKAFYEKHRDLLEIVGVSLDEDRANLVRFVKTHDLPWIQTYSGRGLNDPTAWTYGVDRLPSVLIVDPNGRVRHLKGLVGWYGKKPDTAIGSYKNLTQRTTGDLLWHETLGDAVHHYLTGEFLVYAGAGPFAPGTWTTGGIDGKPMAKLRALVEAMRSTPAAEAKLIHAQAALALGQTLIEQHPDAPALQSVRNAMLVARRVLWVKTRDAEHRTAAHRLAEAITDGADDQGAAARLLADYVLTDRRSAQATDANPTAADAIDAFVKRYAQTQAARSALILANALAVAAGDDATIQASADLLAADHTQSPRVRSYLRYVLDRHVDRGETLTADLNPIDGPAMKLPDDLNDRVAVICFWDAASMRAFNALPNQQSGWRHEPRYSGLDPSEHEDLVVIGVNLDASLDEARPMMQEQLSGWIHTRPEAGWRDELVQHLDIQQLPSTWIVGRDGRITGDDVLNAHVRSGVLTATLHQPAPHALRARTVHTWRVLGPFVQRTGQQYTETGYVAAPHWMRTDAGKQTWLDMHWQRFRWGRDQLERRFSRTSYPPARAEREIDFDATYDDGDGNRIGWRLAGADAYGFVKLRDIFPDAPKPAVAYAVAYVHSATGGQYPIAMSHNDAVTLRVNGREVLRTTAQRFVNKRSIVWPAASGSTPGGLGRAAHAKTALIEKDIYHDWPTVRLRRGWNEIFVKTADVRSTWQLQLRFGDPQRTLRFAAQPDDATPAFGHALPRWTQPTDDQPRRRLLEAVDGPAVQAVMATAHALGDFGWAGRWTDKHIDPYLPKPCLDGPTLLGVMHILAAWEPHESLGEAARERSGVDRAWKLLNPDTLFDRLRTQLRRAVEELANLDEPNDRRRADRRERIAKRMCALAGAIGRLDDPRAVALIRDRLTTHAKRRQAGEPTVPRHCLVNAAGALGHRDLLGELWPLLKHDDERFRRDVIDAMLKIGVTDNRGQLIEAIDNAGWRGFIAMQNIARVGGEQARERIERSIRDHFQHGMPNRNAAERHVTNLGHLADPQALDELAMLIEHDDMGVRQQVIQTMGRIGHTRATPMLLEALADPTNGELRHFIVEALGEIGDPRAQQALIARLEDDGYGVRILAAKALGATGADAAAITALTHALNDPHWLVRTSAAESLGALKAADATEALIGALDDPNSSVRAAVAATLGDLEAAAAIKPLVDRLADWHVGPYAAAALDELNWTPGDNAATRVNHHIASRRAKPLLDDWATTAQVLGEAMKAAGPAATNAVLALIALGRDDMTDTIVAYLKRSDDPAAAAAMLNCGHEPLRRAAANWAVAKGIATEHTRAAPPVAWRSMRP